jgi:hypothetical protein
LCTGRAGWRRGANSNLFIVREDLPAKGSGPSPKSLTIG